MLELGLMHAEPFPHVVITKMWRDQLLEGCVHEIDQLVMDVRTPWQTFRNEREHKNALRFDQVPEWCGALRHMHHHLADPAFAQHLSALTGIPDLLFDGLGGGVHAIPPGGYLAVHRDFNVDERGRWRRVNVLVYLNRNWPSIEAHPADGREWSDATPGALTLWGDPEDGELIPCVVVPPEINTTVIFECNEHSWHGHPVPVPAARWRYSLAAYYFTNAPPPDAEEPHSTIFLEG